MLQILDLSNNKLKSLTDERLFKYQINLQELQLSHNKLTAIGAQVFAPLHTLEKLTLADNPFMCDCDLRFTMMWCDLRNIDTGAICKEPFLYTGLPWTVPKPTGSCKDLPVFNKRIKNEEKLVQEMNLK
jgi:hypothetical protein